MAKVSAESTLAHVANNKIGTVVGALGLIQLCQHMVCQQSHTCVHRAHFDTTECRVCAPFNLEYTRAHTLTPYY